MTPEENIIGVLALLEKNPDARTRVLWQRQLIRGTEALLMDYETTRNTSRRINMLEIESQLIPFFCRTLDVLPPCSLSNFNLLLALTDDVAKEGCLLGQRQATLLKGFVYAHIDEMDKALFCFDEVWSQGFAAELLQKAKNLCLAPEARQKPTLLLAIAGAYEMNPGDRVEVDTLRGFAWLQKNEEGMATVMLHEAEKAAGGNRPELLVELRQRFDAAYPEVQIAPVAVKALLGALRKSPKPRLTRRKPHK